MLTRFKAAWAVIRGRPTVYNLYITDQGIVPRESRLYVYDSEVLVYAPYGITISGKDNHVNGSIRQG